MLPDRKLPGQKCQLGEGGFMVLILHLFQILMKKDRSHMPAQSMCTLFRGPSSGAFKTVAPRCAVFAECVCICVRASLPFAGAVGACGAPQRQGRQGRQGQGAAHSWLLAAGCWHAGFWRRSGSRHCRRPFTRGPGFMNEIQSPRYK